jgi:nicotinamide-nucleotide amidase
MRVGLLNIGDELLAGKILNTNARDLGLWLGELGHELVFMETIADGVEALVGTLRHRLEGSFGSHPEAASGDRRSRYDLLILSGGLGPTHDDFTREALAAYLGTALERNAEATAWLAGFLRIAPEQIGEGQATQLLVPKGVTPLHNTAGTACGLRFEKNGCAVFVFPGVPREFRTLFDAYCKPLLERRDATLLRRRAVTFGLSESRQRDFLRDFKIPEGFRYSSLPNAAGVTLALETFAAPDESTRLEDVLDAAWSDLLGRLPPECIVNRDGTPLLPTVVEMLRGIGATVSVAESCTGGLVGHLITGVPGSSAVFERGFLTYSDDAKRDLLGVPGEVLQTHGAVSEETARAMARGCLAAARSDYAISVTGIAGPDGGTPEKPVGLVFVAAASAREPGRVECARFLFREDRTGNRNLSAYAAINLLRLLILKDLQEIKK